MYKWIGSQKDLEDDTKTSREGSGMKGRPGKALLCLYYWTDTVNMVLHYWRRGRTYKKQVRFAHMNSYHC
jgi:hypothetical protein